MPEHHIDSLEGIVHGEPSPSGFLAFLDSLEDEQPWRAHALCRKYDPELFFPEKGSSVLKPKRICQRCPVLEECRAWGLDDPSAGGVVGGLSTNERRDIRMGRRTLAEVLDPSYAA